MNPVYVIKTKKGWKPLLPPLQPTPEPKRSWTFPGSASYDNLFIGRDGKDVRVTGLWQHRRAA